MDDGCWSISFSILENFSKKKRFVFQLKCGFQHIRCGHSVNVWLGCLCKLRHSSVEINQDKNVITSMSESTSFFLHECPTATHSETIVGEWTKNGAWQDRHLINASSNWFEGSASVRDRETEMKMEINVKREKCGHQNEIEINRCISK